MGADRILLVEDDKEIREGVEIFLRSQGYQVLQAADGVEGLKILEQEEVQLAIVDVMMPRMDGITMVVRLREKYDFPVIFLSAKSEDVDKILGLNMGADDYISKPFRPRELVSRMRTVLRRNSKTPNFLSCREIRIDPVKGIVTKRGEEIFLSALEYRLLLVFFQHIGMVMSRSMLLEEIWDIAGEYVNDNTLTVYIKRLRDKIEDNPQEPKIIKTVRGLGYKMEE